MDIPANNNHNNTPLSSAFFFSFFTCVMSMSLLICSSLFRVSFLCKFNSNSLLFLFLLLMSFLDGPCLRKDGRLLFQRRQRRTVFYFVFITSNLCLTAAYSCLCLLFGVVTRVYSSSACFSILSLFSFTTTVPRLFYVFLCFLRYRRWGYYVSSLLFTSFFQHCVFVFICGFAGVSGFFFGCGSDLVSGFVFVAGFVATPDCL